jgi:ribosomal protein S18 acetylase RimI-like enzyme
MTTTLRPSGPVEQAADGTRERAFRICVNGRPVGEVRLVTDPRFGFRTGRIERLRVDPAERRRGRATVAALAAEEVLRDWGCVRVEAGVPEGAEAARGLATALGYAERTRLMVRTLAERPPAPSETGTVRALTRAEYPAWLAAERAKYISYVTAQGVAHDQAVAAADATYARLLPEGLDTGSTRLRVATHAGTQVGSLWMNVGGNGVPPGMDAYVYALVVGEEHRRRGHGRALMREADRLCHEAGGRRLGLTVFVDNAPALSLYRSLGYRTRDVYLSKPLA